MDIVQVEKLLKFNRVHVTEFRFRRHTIESGRVTKDVPGLVMEPENANVSPNHPGNQREPVKIPDHVLTFKTVETTALRYHMTKNVDASSEPRLWEIEIFFDPEAYPVRPEGALATMWAPIKRGKRAK